MAKNKTNSFEREIMLLLFHNVAATNIGNAGGLLPSTVAGSFYLALFTADPQEGQATISSIEADPGSTTSTEGYPSYARLAIPRNTTNWTVATSTSTSTEGSDPGTKVSNRLLLSFPACGTRTGTATFTHAGLCKGSTRGTNDLIIAGPLQNNLVVGTGVTPQFAGETSANDGTGAISYTEF